MNVMTMKSNDCQSPAPARRAAVKAVAGGNDSFLNTVQFERLNRQNSPYLRDALASPGEGTGPTGGFTLVELLIVISIIGVLSAFILSSIQAVFRNKYENTARAEMAQIEAALERYKAAYGVYPPSGAIGQANRYTVNPLYFELEGVTSTNGANHSDFTTLDGQNTVPSAQILNSFGVTGIINCTRGTVGSEDYVPAKVFLPGLKANQIKTVTNPPATGQPVAILVSSVGGPDLSYQPLGGPSINPWRYNSINPSNNPTSYDLWIQLKIGGKTNLICNWTKQVQVNNLTLP
jgi:prepilin-type N-terminal cleavage/methylation domain-containing protein